MRKLPISITIIFLLSLVYWSYLALTTRMDIVFDAIDYASTGRMLFSQGLVAFFKTGPHREPLYPLLIAASMSAGNLTGLAFVKVMAIFGIVILFLTQALTYKLLRLLNIRDDVSVLVLAYLALSPAFNNTAFSLFSEIAALPLVLGVILTSYYSWEAIKQNKEYTAFIYGILLGLSLALAALVKATFEFLTPVYLVIFFSMIFFTTKETITKKLSLMLCIIAAASFFYVPICGYKWLNREYNGTFTITNRGPCLLYANTARRMEPLTVKKFAEALAYIPGEGVCNSIFDPKECAFWSFQKCDGIASDKLNELQSQHLSIEKENSTLVGLSAQKALHNPLQYALMYFLEGIKMFFWESTQIGFVQYPHWLSKIYSIKAFNNGLRFFVSLITLLAVVLLWCQTLSPRRTNLGFLIAVLVFLYTLSFSFVTIVTRYAMPIAPLYPIAIGIWLDQILAPKKIN